MEGYRPHAETTWLSSRLLFKDLIYLDQVLDIKDRLTYFYVSTFRSRVITHLYQRSKRRKSQRLIGSKPKSVASISTIR